MGEIKPDFRDLVGNMVYVGVLAQMIDIDLDKILAALHFHFKGKQKPIDMNYNMVKAGAEWAKVNLEKKDPYHLEPMNKTDGMIMADGNTAAAIDSVFGGVQFTAWYPITPASSLAEAMNDYLPMLRKREDGKHTYAVVQAEDELAAIGMAVGAGWSGLRSMTSTSGPGLSLMTEFAGLAYYAEVPVVIWDVQRIGPSTGLPTRTSQADLSFTVGMGHAAEPTIWCPASRNCRAMASISAWFSRQPTVSRKTFIRFREVLRAPKPARTVLERSRAEELRNYRKRCLRRAR